MLHLVNRALIDKYKCRVKLIDLFTNSCRNQEEEQVNQLSLKQLLTSVYNIKTTTTLITELKQALKTPNNCNSNEHEQLPKELLQKINEQYVDTIGFTLGLQRENGSPNSGPSTAYKLKVGAGTIKKGQVITMMAGVRYQLVDLLEIQSRCSPEERLFTAEQKTDDAITKFATDNKHLFIFNGEDYLIDSNFTSISKSIFLQRAKIFETRCSSNVDTSWLNPITNDCNNNEHNLLNDITSTIYPLLSPLALASFISNNTCSQQPSFNAQWTDIVLYTTNNKENSDKACNIEDNIATVIPSFDFRLPSSLASSLPFASKLFSSFTRKRRHCIALIATEDISDSSTICAPYSFV